MRAREFIVEYREDYEGITIEMKKHNHQLVVKALDDWGNNELGHVVFNIGDGKELDPQDLEVEEKYQGQGIARVMYDYVKSKGYEIHRSWDQTDAGKGFWDKHRGEDVRIWESSNEFKFNTEPYEGWTGEGIIVRAYDGKDEVGHVIFEPTEDDETQWYAVDVEVEEPYQRRGIATHMYNIAKKAAQAQGKIIVRSHAQSEAGRGLWQDKRVWEDSTPQVLYHATYRPLLKSIKQHGLGGDKAQAKWEDSKPGVVYLAIDPNVAESYAESSDVVPDEWLDQIVVLKVNASQLDQSKLKLDSNVIDNQGDTLEYHGVIPVNLIS